MVEEFSRRLVVGWVSVPTDAPPTKVSLVLGGLVVTSTYATADAAMSGAGSALRGGGAGDASRQSLAHTWQIPTIKGPDDDRRNSRQQIRTFSFRIRGIWPYVKRSTRITVRVDGRPLPIYKHGMYLTPRRNGAESVEALRQRLAQGHVLTQWGSIALSKTLDTEWQQSVMRLYQRTREILADEFGYDAFLVYGTLLGAVREGGYIGHDVDFDAAYVSNETDGRSAADEFQRIALTLIEHGLIVEARLATLHINDPEDPAHRIDLFHCYFDEEGVLRFPFGVAGSSRFTRDDWRGTKTVDLPGSRPGADERRAAGRAPLRRRLATAQAGLQLEPRPDRLRPGGAPVPQQRTKVYWASFYSRNRYRPAPASSSS